MRWVTFFPVVHNIHLTKDLGMLPFHMGKMPDVSASLAGLFPESEYPSLEKEVKGLEVRRLNDAGNVGFASRASLQFLESEGKTIDVLNLYHLNRDTLIYGLRYKKANPSGKLYLKLDAYNAHLKKQKRYSKNAVKNLVLRFMEYRFLKKVDLMSVENREGVQLAKQRFAKYGVDVAYIPNGVNDEWMSQLPEAPKANIILSVGRMGGSDKNYELLLQAIPHLNLQGWKMKVVGPMTDDFREKWYALRTDYPEKCGQIEFLGPIYDREELYKIYQKSRVFFLPSRFESFGIAYVEALFFGSILVGHKGLSAFGDICNEGAFGCYYEDNDSNSFAEAIHSAMDRSLNEDILRKAKTHAAENFYWSKISERLYKRLNEE